jgi:capsular exopolysaccharide synthesis family protein
MMITSSKPSEGKSTTVANLALAIAQAGRRVIVVDGDLRKPAQHRIFKVSNSVGLSNVLARDIELEEAIQYSMIPGVHVLSSGPASPTPAELLGLPVMQDVIAELSTQFDFVLVDSPSLQTVADAAVLSLIVDGLLVVVARGSVRRETVDSALKELAGVHRIPIGIIVSHAEISSNFHYDRPAESDRGSKTPPEPSPRSTPTDAPRLRIIAPGRAGTKNETARSGQLRNADNSTGDANDEDQTDGVESHEAAVLRRIG